MTLECYPGIDSALSNRLDEAARRFDRHCTLSTTHYGTDSEETCTDEDASETSVTSARDAESDDGDPGDSEPVLEEDDDSDTYDPADDEQAESGAMQIDVDKLLLHLGPSQVEHVAAQVVRQHPCTPAILSSVTHFGFLPCAC